MEQFVRDLIRCYEKRGTAEMYSVIAGIPEDIELTHVLFKLLPWLRLEYKRSQWKKKRPYMVSKPLRISADCKWGQDILWLADNHPMFGRYFTAAGNALYISDQIDPEERERALAVVFAEYRPKLMS